MINDDFEKLCEKKDDDEVPAGKEQLVAYIVQNFYRYINNPKSSDSRGLLMLVAALATVSAGDGSSKSLTAARRLATAALARGNR